MAKNTETELKNFFSSTLLKAQAKYISRVTINRSKEKKEPKQHLRSFKILVSFSNNKLLSE